MPAKTFAERFPPDVTLPYARRTFRLQELFRHLGLALGRRPTQALAAQLLLPITKDTFFRSIRDTAKASSSDLRVTGIVYWTWRTWQRNRTLISDLKGRRVIDLLPDLEPATVKAWLRAIRRIVRQTGLNSRLVRQIAPGERKNVFRIRENSLPPRLPRLKRESADGCRTGTELWRRLRADGFQRSLRIVGEWATRQRRAERAAPSGPEKSPPDPEPGSSVQSRCHPSRKDRSFSTNPR